MYTFKLNAQTGTCSGMIFNDCQLYMTHSQGTLMLFEVLPNLIMKIASICFLRTLSVSLVCTLIL